MLKLKLLKYFGITSGVLAGTATVLNVLDIVDVGRLLPIEATELVVFVHGPGGPQDILLENEGYVILDINKDRRREKVQDKGQVFFAEIPTKYEDSPIYLTIDAPGYALAFPDSVYQLSSSTIYLEVKRASEFNVISGYVRKNGKEASGVHVLVKHAPGNLQVTTDSVGYFRIQVPDSLVRDVYELVARHPGFNPVEKVYQPGANPITINLD